MTIVAAEKRISGRDHAAAERRRRIRLPDAIAVLLGTGLIGAHAARYGHWLIDDAAITFAYARSVSDGFGPVLQRGADPVEGFSNPAWLALLAVGRRLALFDRGTIFGVPDYVFFPKALAAMCCAGILVACHRVAAASRTRAWVATLLAALTLAAIPSFVIWSFSGLENSLYGLAVAWLAAVMFTAVVGDRLLSRQVAVTTGLLVSLATLTRPDGLIFVAAYPLVVLIGVRRRPLGTSIRAVLVSGIACVVPCGGYLLWRLVVFGRLVPNTAVAKGQRWPELADLARAGELTTYSGHAAIAALALCVAIVLVRRSLRRSALMAILVPLALALVAFCILDPDWMGHLRLATPVWVLSAMVIALVIPHAMTVAGPRGRWLFLFGLVAAAIPSLSAFVTSANRFRASPTVPVCLVSESFGRGFNGYADLLRAKEATLLVADIGGTAMTSRLELYDLAGLAEARIAEYWHDGDMVGLRDYVFTKLKPTFIHAHGPWYTATGLAADQRLEAEYYLIGSFGGDGGGDWVRNDVVNGPAEFAALRDYGATTRANSELAARRAPRSHCGPVLRPGQVPARH